MINSDIYSFEYEFLDDYNNFCIHNNIKLVLDYYGVKHSSLYIDTIPGIRFCVNEDEPENLECIYDIDSTSVLSPFDSLIHINYPRDKSDSVGNFAEIKKNIDAGIPVIVMVDVYDLPYMPFYHTEHSIHSILVCGYDDSKEEITYVDWYSPYFSKGTIGYRDYFRARASENPAGTLMNSGFPIKNRWVLVERDGWNAKPDELLKHTIDKMEFAYYSKINTQYAKECEGIGAIMRLQTLLQEMSRMPEKYAKAVLSKLHKYFFMMPNYWNLFSSNILKNVMVAGVAVEDEKLNILQNNNVLWTRILRLFVKANMGNYESVYPKILASIEQIIENDFKSEHILHCIKTGLSKN
ncbi:BtrH N-terminal domain-containing protein [[Clostridium] polysaccharolyticum]|uniref:Butirosin biosynthesis protein H, N-terminal n=1 Tax=[Clostridium] polysaccharolyticum TaxID=29364 RepID=A0A1I0BDV0_9FIRM|nr:BtrH N-terminal domain-containing protein [[Clostridium] polysaccharolyticum]SET05078.1 Butirosin biosynthesis protein H, N-terminal [[Clostridium] polysaccharolyticum]